MSRYLCACSGSKYDTVSRDWCADGHHPHISGVPVSRNDAIAFIDDPDGCHTCKKKRIATGGRAILVPNNTSPNGFPTVLTPIKVCGQMITCGGRMSYIDNIKVLSYVPPLDQPQVAPELRSRCYPCMRWWIHPRVAPDFCCLAKRDAMISNQSQ